jgi:aspartate dehydrogenase
LRTTKPPKALENAPYLKEKNISLKDLKEKKLVFQGNALQAIRGFPANVNTAVAVSLAGIGAEKTTVEIVADPQSTRNIHEISAEGEFGKLYFKVENLPSPENPRTSLLAAFSAIATLKSITKPMVIGT